MIYGISGTAIPGHLKYAQAIQTACVQENFPPCLAYAIAWRETISGEGSQWIAAKVISFDKGYGLFQLTFPFGLPWPPAKWDDPTTNTQLAIKHYLKPGMNFFVECGVSGDTLIRCLAAGFNSGNMTAWRNHLLGNVDLGTTGHNYASSVLGNYHRLLQGEEPL